MRLLISFSARNFVARTLVCGCLLLPVTTLLAQQAKTASPPPAQIANFIDIAEKAGLTAQNIFGGLDTKKYIIETTGTGVAIFDYDNDGWPDIFLVNGTRLEGSPAGQGPTNRLYRNNHDGTFTDVTAKAGLTATGWGQGVCVGDYDNDGWEDLYVTYYGKNRLYHNRSRSLHRSCRKIRRRRIGQSVGHGLRLRRLRPRRAPRPDGRELRRLRSRDGACAGRAPDLHLERRSRDVRPARPAGSKNILYHNRGDGTFEDVTTKAHIDRTDGHYAFSVSTFDFDEDGWPDIFVACDSTPSILYRNNHDGTFTDVAVTAGAAFNEDGREQAGMGSTIADYNGDGHLDIFKTNFSDDTSTLYNNNGDGTFTDATAAAGLGLYTQYLGLGDDVFRFRQRRLARSASGERPRLSRSRQPAPGQQLQRAAHSLSQQRRRNVQRHLRVRRSRHYDARLVARTGSRRFMERRQNVGSDQQHECGAQPARKPSSQCESLGRDSYRGNEIES